MVLYEESALPALIQGVKNKYKNKGLMTKITEYNLRQSTFHLALPNIVQLIHQYLEKHLLNNQHEYISPQQIQKDLNYTLLF